MLKMFRNIYLAMFSETVGFEFIANKPVPEFVGEQSF